MAAEHRISWNSKSGNPATKQTNSHELTSPLSQQQQQQQEQPGTVSTHAEQKPQQLSARYGSATLKSRIKSTVARVPFLGTYLAVLPSRAVYTILCLIAANALVWVAVGVALHYNPSLASSALLAYTLGLRHALDADHIAAIDLVARRLSEVTGRIGLSPVQQDHSSAGGCDLEGEGERVVGAAEEDISLLDSAAQKLREPPMTIGLFFSLGHSTVVVITAIVTAATAAAVSKKFDRFSHVGGIIGTSVSTAFLVLLSSVNGYMLYRLVKQMRAVLAARRHGNVVEEDIARPLSPVDNEHSASLVAAALPTAAVGDASIATTPSVPAQSGNQANPHHLPGEGVGGGILFRIFRTFFRFVDRPWKMYPLGFVFGLGFDTSSEIALLGLAAVQAARGTSIWLILIFPILFTAGMALLDTTDGALMMTLYVASSRSKDGTVAILYYSIVLTSITVAVSAMIGTVQALNLAEAVGGYHGPFWDGLDRLGEVWDIVGGAVCGCFVVFGLLSVVLYKPWRRRYDPAYRKE